MLGSVVDIEVNKLWSLTLKFLLPIRLNRHGHKFKILGKLCHKLLLKIQIKCFVTQREVIVMLIKTF